jgi:hypothetical protein
MFLFIAKKEASEDYCRGCLMERYPADVFLENWLSREQLVDRWSDHLLRNMNLGHSESGYHFFVFKGGVKVFDGESLDGTCWDGRLRYDCGTEELYKQSEELKAQEKADLEEIADIYAEAKSRAAEKHFEKKQQEYRERDAKAAQEAEEAKRKRLTQYEALKKEFDS